MKNKKGFTLIELLVVIAIIGLLSTLAVVSLNTARGKARDARRMSDLKQISTAFELYYAEKAAYPGYGTGAAGECALAGIVVNAADAAGIETMCCGQGTPICMDNAGNADCADAVDVTLLNAAPCLPGLTTGYGFESEAGTASYCIEAALETANQWFVCSNGSCFELTTAAVNACGQIGAT